MGNMSTKISKEHIAISIIGHVDSGKSTLTGQLSLKFGKLDARMLAKLQKDADAINKSSFALASFTDRTKEERTRGVTINTTLVKLETPRFEITVLDCPGHADYIKNATSGCKQSDVSIVVCPARFEASCSSEGTLKTHLTLASVLGSKKFIVCINKLDEVQIVHETSLKTAFDAACAAVMQLLKRLAVNKDDVIFLPISALKCIGLFKDGEQYPFFEGAPVKEKVPGQNKIFSLEEAIDYQDSPLRAVDRPLRMPVASIAHVPGHGAVLCGRVDYGSLTKGKAVKILPIGLSTKVKSVEAHNESVEVANAGSNIGVVLDTKDKTAVEKIRPGSITGSADDSDFVCSPFYTVSGISMKKSKKGADKSGISVGYTPVISCGTANIATKIVKIIKCVTKDKVVIENPETIPTGARFDAIVYPTKPVVFEAASSYPGLGKFVARDSGSLVFAGQITGKVTEAEAKQKFDIDTTVLSGDKEAIKKAKAATKGRNAAAAA